MTLSSTVSRISYAGNGVTTLFSFPYYFLANADLVVILKVTSTGVETTKVITTDYTITGAGAQAGGAVTMIVAPAVGETLTIYRDPAATQTTDLVENDALPAETVEMTLDKLMMVAQRLKDFFVRSIRLTDGYSATFDTTLPPELDQAADKVVTINSTATGFAPVADWPSSVDVSAAAANAAAAAASAAASAASAAASAASAAIALTAVNSVIFSDVYFKTFADSPITVSPTLDRGKVFSIDCSGGAVVVNLPDIAGLDLSTPYTIAIKKTDTNAANPVTINRASTDTIEGATSKSLLIQHSGCILVPDLDPAPDKWTTIDFGNASSGGGGGGSLQWVEDVDAPLSTVENGDRVYFFDPPATSNVLYALIRVPNNYVAGSPVNLRSVAYSTASAGATKLETVATLIRPGTDTMSSTTNQRSSTNTAITWSGATVNKPQSIAFDLTSTIGQINGVAISAGDLIRIKMDMATDSSGITTKVPVYGAEVTFT